jgi:hypothetical protein
MNPCVHKRIKIIDFSIHKILLIFLKNYLLFLCTQGFHLCCKNYFLIGNYQKTNFDEQKFELIVKKILIFAIFQKW